uniref:actin isoform X2 n=1 Tax=Ciona intestinalis TaxID=7719 RepID=UPI000EF4442C|nr:actin isoform X2 [Ciona intestinalis]|eukprot:XP_026696111.1 actin isoform X2 [Ciona intestinalis]
MGKFKNIFKCCWSREEDCDATTNGNDECRKESKLEGFSNLAYDATTDVTSSPLKCTTTRPIQSRQVSDISELYRIPDDGKSLSELVFEELDKHAADVTHNDVTHDDAAAGSSNVNNNSNNYDDHGSMHFKPSVADSEWRNKLRLELEEPDTFFESDDDDVDEDVKDDDVADDVGDDVELTMTSRNPGNISRTSSNRPIVLERPLVIDNGSYRVRFGWGGDFAPTATTRNIVGRWRAEASEAWQEALGSKFIGDVAIDRHATLNLHSPIRDGRITNWENMRDVWSDVMDDDVDVTQHPVLITEHVTIDRKQRERMAELDVGGRHVTEYLARLANTERGCNLVTTPEVEVVNSIKEEFAFLRTADSDKQAIDKEFELPDGRTIKLGDELTRCGEVLFNPGVVTSQEQGLPQLVSNTINKLDPDFVAETGGLVYITGGASGLGGLEERLQKEVDCYVTDAVVQLLSRDENAAWIGGSLFTEQSNFCHYCVTEDDYFEQGPRILHRVFC